MNQENKIPTKKVVNLDEYVHKKAVNCYEEIRNYKMLFSG